MSEPASTVQTITNTIDSLRGTPVLLALVLLNGFFIAGAAYYLINSDGYRATERLALINALDRCVQNTVPTDFLRDRK